MDVHVDDQRRLIVLALIALLSPGCMWSWNDVALDPTTVRTERRLRFVESDRARLDLRRGQVLEREDDGWYSPGYDVHLEGDELRVQTPQIDWGLSILSAVGWTVLGIASAVGMFFASYYALWITSCVLGCAGGG